MPNTLPTGSEAITDPNNPSFQMKINADGSINSNPSVGGVAVSTGNPLPVSQTPVTTPVLNLASASQALPYTGADLPVSSLKELAIGINLTAMTGGTAPTVTFFITSKGLDGIYYTIYTGGANPGAASLPLSLGMGANSPGGVAFGSVIRLNAVGGGTIAPTAATFSASIIGK